jgi:hypothetical protein
MMPHPREKRVVFYSDGDYLGVTSRLFIDPNKRRAGTGRRVEF